MLLLLLTFFQNDITLRSCYASAVKNKLVSVSAFDYGNVLLHLLRQLLCSCMISEQNTSYVTKHCFRLLPHAVSCGKFCFWRRQPVVFWAWNISETAERICAKFTRKTCLVPRSDEFEGQGQRSKANVTRDKKLHISALSAACVQFMFGKISLACSF